MLIALTSRPNLWPRYCGSIQVRLGEREILPQVRARHQRLLSAYAANLTMGQHAAPRAPREDGVRQGRLA